VELTARSEAAGEVSIHEISFEPATLRFLQHVAD
jgi:hypothetical protein